jgi:hypothetical protein
MMKIELAVSAAIATCAVAVLTIPAAIPASAAVVVLCPKPDRGLRLPDPVFRPRDVDGQATAFNYKSATFPLEIYSGFAPQNAGNNSNYCIRYEAQNTGSHLIEKFFWPLATLQLDTLEPGKRESIVLTKPPGSSPIVGESWVYGFLSSAVRTYAYQKTSSNQPIHGRQRFAQLDSPTDNVVRTSITPDRRTLLATVEDLSGRHTFKDPETMPQIGAQYSGSGSDEVTAVSEAKWDGKRFAISFHVGRNNAESVKGLSAPFAYAMSKIDIASSLLTTFDLVKRLPLPLTDNSFESTLSLEPLTSPPTIYIVDQPITYTRGNGRVCFLAAAYSPIPIPSNILGCNLF